MAIMDKAHYCIFSRILIGALPFKGQLPRPKINNTHARSSMGTEKETPNMPSETRRASIYAGPTVYMLV
jgi:hypothetical protein